MIHLSVQAGCECTCFLLKIELTLSVPSQISISDRFCHFHMSQMTCPGSAIAETGDSGGVQNHSNHAAVLLGPMELDALCLSFCDWTTISGALTSWQPHLTSWAF